MTRPLLTRAEVAGLLKVTPRTVQKLNIRQVRIGRAVRYRPEDVQRYIDRRVS
jgi:excisionase family DNA binding protein